MFAVRPALRPPMRRRAVSVAVSGCVACLVVCVVVAAGVATDAAPANDRAFHGYDSVGTNGFGATESWAGNLRLFTGDDQSGETIIGYCIQRGLDYPRGTDPQFSDANSGFALIGDVPAQRGVSEADRRTLGYLLWRYGATTDDRTAAAMFLLTHLLSADPDFGSTTLESTVLGSDWPDPGSVRARSSEILTEARARRGPWTVSVDIGPAPGRSGEVSIAVDVSGPGGPIAGVDVALSSDGGAFDDWSIDVLVTTGDDGRAVHVIDVTGVDGDLSGDVQRVVDAPDVTEVAGESSGDVQRVVDAPDVTGVDAATADDGPGELAVVATVASTPGGYRVFHGRPGTQQVITDAGDGPAIADTARVRIPVTPPPTQTTTVAPTTTTVVPTTTTTVAPTTTTTVAPTTTTTVVPTTTTTVAPTTSAVAPVTTVGPSTSTTAAPTSTSMSAPSTTTTPPAVTVVPTPPTEPGPPAAAAGAAAPTPSPTGVVPAAEPALADTGRGVAGLAVVGGVAVAGGLMMVGTVRRLTPLATTPRRRAGGAHLRRADPSRRWRRTG